MIKVTGFHHRLIINLWNSNVFEKSYERNYFNTDATSCAVTVRKPICLLVVFNLAGDWGRRGDRRDAHPFCYWWWWWKTWRSARPSWLQRLRTSLLRKSTGGGRDLLQYFLLLTFVSSVVRLPTGRWKVNGFLASLYWTDAFTHCDLNFNGFHHFKIEHKLSKWLLFQLGKQGIPNFTV